MGRYTRETGVFTPLEVAPALKPGRVEDWLVA
jgi:hypothetical protein